MAKKISLYLTLPSGRRRDVNAYATIRTLRVSPRFAEGLRTATNTPFRGHIFEDGKEDQKGKI